MKTFVQTGICLLLMAVIPTFSWAQTKAERKQQRAQMVKECMESKQFRIEPNSALTMSGWNVQLNSYYSLEVRNDSVFSYLPYYGRGYNVPYGGGEGLNFEAKVEDYKQSIGKKGNYEIEFSARTREDFYTFHIDVYDNGSSSIHVNMQRRQSIDFLGDLVFKENDEE